MNKQSYYRIIVISVISAILILFVFLWLRNKSAPDPEPEIRPIPVSIVQPAIYDLREELVLSAVLESERTVAVIPKVSGTILEILTEEGSVVSKGDILARIDPEPYLLELQAAESSWLLADSSLSRITRLKESSGVSQQQFDEAKAARDSAYSRYELVKMRYGYSEIKAPVSGLILRRFSDSGNPASSEKPLFLIGDDGNPQLKVHIPEKYWSSFTNNDSSQLIKALVSYPAGGDMRVKESRILRIGPGISPETKTFEVTCSVPSDGNIWPIGARMRVEIILRERKDSWSLPLRSLTAEGEVWVVDPDSLSVSRQDVPVLFQDNKRFAIPDEWSERVFVLDGQHLLREGQLVLTFESDI